LHTCLRRVRIQIIWLPCCREGVIGARILLLVLRNGRLQLLLPDIAPGAHSVADDLDVELRHPAESRFKHAKGKKDYMFKELRGDNYNCKVTIYRTSSCFEPWNRKENDYLSWRSWRGWAGRPVR
jgi:hypothetical protein